MKTTMIQIKKSTALKLKAFKIYPRQSYDEIINSLIDRNIDEEELTAEEMKEIEESLEEVKRGETISLEEYAKKHNINLE